MRLCPLPRLRYLSLAMFLLLNSFHSHFSQNGSHKTEQLCREFFASWHLPSQSFTQQRFHVSTNTTSTWLGPEKLVLFPIDRMLHKDTALLYTVQCTARNLRTDVKLYNQCSFVKVETILRDWAWKKSANDGIGQKIQLARTPVSVPQFTVD